MLDAFWFKFYECSFDGIVFAGRKKYNPSTVGHYLSQGRNLSQELLEQFFKNGTHLFRHFLEA